MRWTFDVGIMRARQVTVRARNREEAVLAAREELDRQALESNTEAPVAWDLILVEAK